MQHGDLTNVKAPEVGIKFEAVLYNFGKVNQPGKAFCDGLLAQDLNLLLITCLPERKARSWCYKWGIGYSQVIEAAGPLEIPEICFQRKLMAYYDVDDRVLEMVRLRGNPRTEGIRWEQDGSAESFDYKTNR